uniref:Uncharacterized protein n=1 Tax=Aegilops tauschii subsp. strangulata TaxID=200361 RepID=A0A453N0H3_AEGTS
CNSDEVSTPPVALHRSTRRRRRCFTAALTPARRWSIDAPSQHPTPPTMFRCSPHRHDGLHCSTPTVPPTELHCNAPPLIAAPSQRDGDGRMLYMQHDDDGGCCDAARCDRDGGCFVVCATGGRHCSPSGWELHHAARVDVDLAGVAS